MLENFKPRYQTERVERHSYIMLTVFRVGDDEKKNSYVPISYPFGSFRFSMPDEMEELIEWEKLIGSIPKKDG